MNKGLAMAEAVLFRGLKQYTCQFFCVRGESEKFRSCGSSITWCLASVELCALTSVLYHKNASGAKRLKPILRFRSLSPDLFS